MNEFVDAFKKYAEFNGRATRREYWMFFVVNFVIILGLIFVDLIIGFPILGFAYSLAVIVPSISIAVRRLHDIGKPGVYWFVTLIPFVGTIWFIILMATESDMNNEYGPCRDTMPTY